MRWPNSPGKTGINMALLFLIKLNKTDEQFVAVFRLCRGIGGRLETCTHGHKPLVTPQSIICQRLVENV